MLTRETFYRSTEIHRESRTLPAPVYNLARGLLQRSALDAVFVPIRSMLYQAVIDREEILFLDAAVSQRDIVLAWQYFRTHGRSLDAPVTYEVAYYKPGAFGIMPRLQGEFFKSLTLMRLKQIPSDGRIAKVISLEGRQSDPHASDTQTPRLE